MSTILLYAREVKLFIGLDALSIFPGKHTFRPYGLRKYPLDGNIYCRH